ncbi:MAG TPA: hypothetical protein VGL56_09170 [Fimbriimonadaceae bacterium]
MRYLLLAFAAISVLAVAGCGSSDDAGPAKAGSGVAQNPGGKPQNAQEQANADARAKEGSAINADMAKDAAAMKAAKARTGGK